jgi:hypothetical protein
MNSHEQRLWAAINVGDQLRFAPSSGRWPWTVQARDDRFIVATTQWPFKPKGTRAYTVVDLTGWQDKHYNGQRPGVVRSSLDTLGGGWGDGVFDRAECKEILAVLQSGEHDLSHRRALSVRAVDVVAVARAMA